MTQFIEGVSGELVSALAGSAVRSLIVAGVAAGAVAVFRFRATSLQLLIWRSVLCAGILLPFAGWLLPSLQVSLPRFLKSQPSAQVAGRVVEPNRVPTSHGAANNQRELKAGADSPSPQSITFRATALTSPASVRVAWEVIAATFYLAVTVIFLVRFLAGIIWSRCLVRNALPISEAAFRETLVFKRASDVRLASSEQITVPLTVGVFRPTILFPPNWREWDQAKLEAVLAHESSHVARRDTLTQCVALFYRAIFWFNPLAWWLQRHLSDLAEQASDEAALSGGVDQKHYARTLLDFFDALRTTPGRVRWQGVSMARVGQAEQRLERILTWKGSVAMTVKRSLAAVILALAVPVIYLAAAVRPAAPKAAAHVVMGQASTPSAPAAPPVGGIVAPHIAGAPAVPPTPTITAVTPMAPAAPVGFGQSHSSGTGHGRGFSYAYGFDDEERFVIVSGKSDAFTMSGSSQDAQHVEKLKKQIPGDFIWFQRDEKSYIIRDQATIDRARKLWAPQEELGRKQEELGKQQEELGRQQEELGQKMEQVKVDVPDMTAELDRLKAKLQKLGPTATVEQMGELQSEIGELQSKLGELQSHAGDQQGKIGELQGQLGEKQGKLGEEQGKLGEQQAELAEKATREMKVILDEAIKNGTAKSEEEIVKNPTL